MQVLRHAFSVLPIRIQVQVPQSVLHVRLERSLMKGEVPKWRIAGAKLVSGPTRRALA